MEKKSTIRALNEASVSHQGARTSPQHAAVGCFHTVEIGQSRSIGSALVIGATVVDKLWE